MEWSNDYNTCSIDRCCFYSIFGEIFVTHTIRVGLNPYLIYIYSYSYPRQSVSVVVSDSYPYTRKKYENKYDINSIRAYLVRYEAHVELEKPLCVKFCGRSFQFLVAPFDDHRRAAPAAMPPTVSQLAKANHTTSFYFLYSKL